MKNKNTRKIVVYDSTWYYRVGRKNVVFYRDGELKKHVVPFTDVTDMAWKIGPYIVDDTSGKSAGIKKRNLLRVDVWDKPEVETMLALKYTK